MGKRAWWVALILSAIIFLLPVSSVFAVTTAPGFTTWPSTTTTEVNKVWTITFNTLLLNTSVNSNTIYVKNSKQEKVATTVKLSSDGLSVTVTPTKAYTDGEFHLYITSGIMSRASEKLSEQIIVPFVVIGALTPTVVVTPDLSILDVQSNFNSVVTVFEVNTAPNVYRVDVNKTKMQYSGNSTYTAGVYGAKLGSTITFEAYNQDGKLLQTYKYQL